MNAEFVRRLNSMKEVDGFGAKSIGKRIYKKSDFSAAGRRLNFNLSMQEGEDLFEDGVDA